MENPATEAGKVANAITDTFENLRLIVATLSIAVGIRNIKGIEDVLAPVVDSSGTFIELWKMSVFCANNPVTEQFFGDLAVRRMHKEEKVVFQIISLFKPSR